MTLEPLVRKLVWWLINLDMLLVLLIALGFIFYMFKKRGWAKFLILTASAGIVFVAVVPVGFWAIEHLENRFPKPKHLPPDTTGIILLGGNFDRMGSVGREETVHNMAAGRLIDFIKLANKYPDLRLVFTGGGRPIPFHDGPDLTEAEVMKRELEALNFDISRVTFEDRSLNTIENAQKTKDLIKPTPDQKWVLVTSAFHLPRSVGLFRKAGWTIIPYPVDYHTPGHYEPYFFIGLYNGFFTLHYAVWEWAAMIQNYVFGRSDELYPAP